MSHQIRCPLCEEGQLHERQDKSPVEYNGQRTELDLLFSECDACGAEQTTPGQTKRNKRAMVAFKKEVDGLLTGEQVRALRTRLELTQAQAAKVFGGGAVAFSKYESDDVTQSEAMDKLLRIADGIPSAFAWLAARAEMKGCAAEWETTITSQSLSQPNAHMKLVHNQDWDNKRYG